MPHRTQQNDLSTLLINSVFAFAIALMLSACGGSSSSSSPAPSNDGATDEGESPVDSSTYYEVGVNFFKGPVNGATCELYQTDGGIKGAALISGSTNAQGHVLFAKPVVYQGIALIECLGGTYIDESSEVLSTTPTPIMRAVVEFIGISGSRLEFVVSPLTEIATSLAENSDNGLSSALTDKAFNQSVALAFGLDSSVNITSLVPENLLTVIMTENSSAATYGFALALFSDLVNSDDLSRTLAQVMTDLTNDLSNELAAGNTLFSQGKREELGEAVQHYSIFGSLVNSSLQATSIRRDIAVAANFILPVIETGGTDSINQPLETIRAELVEYIVNNNLQPLPQAPQVTSEMYSLGQALAFDKILSGNKDTSCLSCHHPLLATGDARSLPLGAGGVKLGQARSGGHVIARHAQPLFNLDLYQNLFWDGRVQLNEQGNLSTPADTTGDLTQAMSNVFFANQASEGFQGYGLVAAQAMFPVTDTHEMRGEIAAGNELAAFAADDFSEIWQALMTRLGAIPKYVQMFEAAYPNIAFEDMTFAHAANAIAGFEVSAFELRNNPWQQVIADVSADGIFDRPDIFDEQTTRGAHFFFDTGCINCHSGSMMSDFDFHSISTIQFGPGKGSGDSGFEDWGRELITGNSSDRAKFRTAPLFNVALSAPYAHLGQFADLWSHIQIYAIPERFWLNLYTGYDRIVGDFVHVPDFENQVTDNEKTLFKTFPLPSDDGNSHGFFKTLNFIETQVERASADAGRLTLEEGKRLGDGELNEQRQILLPFMAALTDPATTDLTHLIPSTVPSGLSVEVSLAQ